jgi:hypothetical protein
LKPKAVGLKIQETLMGACLSQRASRFFTHKHLPQLDFFLMYVDLQHREVLSNTKKKNLAVLYVSWKYP